MIMVGHGITVAGSSRRMAVSAFVFGGGSRSSEKFTSQNHVFCGGVFAIV